MSFSNELAQWPAARIQTAIAGVHPEDVDAALARSERTPHDLAALLSPHARPRLEAMALEAQRLTRRQFGRTVGLYAPLYLSNVCAADCLYCGFAAHSGNRERRITLDAEAIRRECEALAGRGFRHVLVLTGEAPTIATLDYLADAVAIVRERFDSVSAEIYPLTTDGYRRLAGCGLEGVTLYIETYDPSTYERMHPAGLKRDYAFRLEALERAGAAGVRRLNLGVLLGLSDWRIEAFRMGLHGRYLQKHYWRSAISVSFPRLRHTPKRFTVPAPVRDADLVQLMLALRLVLPEAGFTLSTREPAALRDRLIPLGVTLISAGSSTRPGGYANTAANDLEQFAIEDLRSPAEVAAAIVRAGYDPVWKDFDRAFTDDAG